MQRVITLARSRDAEAVARENMQRLELTSGQQDIARLVMGGYSNTEIAQMRGVSVSTIKNTMTFIFARTGATSRADLVALLLGLSAEEVRL